MGVNGFTQPNRLNEVMPHTGNKGPPCRVSKVESAGDFHRLYLAAASDSTRNAVATETQVLYVGPPKCYLKVIFIRNDFM